MKEKKQQLINFVLASELAGKMLYPQALTPLPGCSMGWCLVRVHKQVPHLLDQRNRY